MHIVVYNARGNRTWTQNVATQEAVKLSHGSHVEPIIDIPRSFKPSTLSTLYMGQSWSSMVGTSYRQPPYGWIMSLTDVHRCNTASNLALKALLFARNGHQIGNNDLSFSSYRMYNCALAAVARQCSRNKDTMGDDTMAAVLLLALYEVCELRYSSEAH